MDQISAMLGLDLDDEQKARLMADQLRGRKQAADFFGMTTIPQIAKGAQQEGQDIMDSAQRGGALRQTMANREQQNQMQQDRFDEDERVRALERALALKDRKYEEGREYEEDMRESPQTWIDRATGETSNFQSRGGEWINVDNLMPADFSGKIPFKQTGGMKPPASVQKDYLNSVGLERQAETILGLYDEFNDEQKAMANQPVGEVIADTAKSILPDSAVRLAEEQLMYTDPLVRAYRGQGANMESTISKALSGSQVTSFEMADRKNWSPWAPGISTEERNRRVEQMRQAFDFKRKDINTQYPGYFNTQEQAPDTSKYPPTWGPQEIAEWEAQNNG